MKRNESTRKEKYKEYRDSIIQEGDIDEATSDITIEEKPKLNSLIIEFKKKRVRKLTAYYIFITILLILAIILVTYIGIKYL